MNACVSELPDAAEKAHVVEEMFDRIAPRYDLLNRMLTFGMDIGWRKAAVRAIDAVAGAPVLDIACGTGDLCRTLQAEQYRPIGADFSEGMLRKRHSSAPVVRADALRLPFPDASFAGITCGFALRNFTDLEAMLTESRRVLVPGGRISLLDVSSPSNPVARAAHAFWFRRVVPVIGGVVSDRAAYRYLPASTAYLPPREELLTLIAEAGFVDVTWRAMGFGAVQLIVGRRP